MTRVQKTNQTGGMIALIPREADAAKLVVPGGDPAEEMHLTLVYLGDDATGMSAEDRTSAAMAAGSAAQQLAPVTTRVFAHATFNPDGYAEREPCSVYLVGDSPVIGPLRGALTPYAAATQHEPYFPHITAGYGVMQSRLSYAGEVVFDRLRLAIGDNVLDFPLGDTEEIKSMMSGSEFTTMVASETKGKMPPELAERFKKKGNGKPSDDKGGTEDSGINNIGDLAKAIKAYKSAKADAKAAMWSKINSAAKRLKATKMLSGLERPKQEKSIEDELIEAAIHEYKVASPHPGAAKLRAYWAHGKGRAKWRPGTPGDFNRLVRQLRKYVKNPRILKGLAANIHHMATGQWPGRGRHHKDVIDWVDALEIKSHGAEILADEMAEQYKAARAELEEVLGESGDDDAMIEETSPEDVFEQALTDDVDWQMDADGTLHEPDDESDLMLDEPDEDGESSDAEPDDLDELDDLISLANPGASRRD